MKILAAEVGPEPARGLMAPAAPWSVGRGGSARDGTGRARSGMTLRALPAGPFPFPHPPWHSQGTFPQVLRTPPPPPPSGPSPRLGSSGGVARALQRPCMGPVEGHTDGGTRIRPTSPADPAPQIQQVPPNCGARAGQPGPGRWAWGFEGEGWARLARVGGLVRGGGCGRPRLGRWAWGKVEAGP